MSDFHHLGFFPYCVKTGVLPSEYRLTVSLRDAMWLFWTAQTATLSGSVSYGANPLEGTDELDRVFITVPASASFSNEQRELYPAKPAARDRVCSNGEFTLSATGTDEGTLSFLATFFWLQPVFNQTPLDRISFEGQAGVDASVVINVRIEATLSGFYTEYLLQNSPSNFVGITGYETATYNIPVTINGNSYTIKTQSSAGLKSTFSGAPNVSQSYSIVFA